MARLLTCAAAVLAGLLLPTAADAVVPYSLGADGMTAPAYSYAGAARERVYIPQPGIDQNGDGIADDIAIEIMRPVGVPPGRGPAIIDPSPYYTTICRGNESQCIGDTDNNGINDKWPLFLDNYFVPRGYAVILAEPNGTANSTGCPMHGGPGDVAGMRSVVDWLNGRVPGYSDAAHAHAAVAWWHNGSSAMIGKSYDGTLTEGVAATGVEGLKAIVPESAIDDWYAYSRMGGIRFNTDYPSVLSAAITDAADRTPCAPSRTTLNGLDGDETGDRNAFWDARNYLANVGNVKAAVLDAHGLQDDNVRMDHLASWWAGLAANNVPRKLWLMRAGHADPFDVRRSAWVDTVHKWFDHWLYGIDNDVMTQPRVDLQNADGTWHTESDWPAPAAAAVDLHLRATAQDQAGDLGLASGGALDSVSWTDAPTQSETIMMNSPTGSQAARRVFRSAPLKHDLRVSGTPVVHLRASLSTTQSNLGALLVDYGTGTQITRANEGISNTVDRTCWGDSVAGDYSACYLEVTQPKVNVSQWRVSKGILDSSNRASLSVPSLVTADQPADFPITLLPQDHVFATGHQIGVILVGDYRDFTSIAGTPGATITMDTHASTISLPVVGGATAAAATGAFDTITPTLTVPSDISTTATSAAGAAVTWPAPAVSDDQDPSPTVECAPASASAFAIGTTTVTCTATDASGNATIGSFKVIVGAPANKDDHSGDGGQTIGGTQTSPSGDTPASAATAGAILPAAPPTSLDVVPTRLTALTISGARRQLVVAFRLSSPATVTITATRAGARRPTATMTTRLKTSGRSSLRLHSNGLRPGRYTITMKARSAAGVVTTVRRTVTVRA